MTEYGRGPGSEPWYPDDPLYGDPGWNGAQHGDWDPYGGQQQQQYHPQHQPQHHSQQQPHASHQEPHHQDPHLSPYGGQGWDTQGTGQPYGTAADPYGGQYHGHPGQHGHQGHYPDPSGHQQGHFDHQGHQGHFEHPQQGHQGQYPDPSGHQGQYHPGHHDGQDAHPPQPGPHEHPHQPQQPHPAPGRRRGGPEPGGEPDPGPDEETGWDPGPDQGEHAFFADDHDGYDDYDEDDGDGRPARGGRDRRGRAKRRNAGACLIVAAVLVGGVGTAGYFAYDFYQSHFAAAPDFSGQGSGEVQVEIPEGSTLAQMGAILEKAGVVKSQGAFIEASNDNTKSQGIQPGVYMLRKEMSAATAIEMMLDPASQNALIIAEGKRASEIYALIDEKLGLEEGTTAKAAEKADLGLPEWAEGSPEGFLFPAKYTVGDKTKPEDLLKTMVQRAEKEFARVDLEGQAGQLGLQSPMDVLTVASLVQAEGKYKHDFEKVSRVVYNRLKPGNTETNGYLQFDSTYNYAKNQYTLDVPSPSAMARFDHPYNTYAKKGLPPGPINSPGAEALHAAVEPAEGGWYYFVSVTEDNTVFTDTYEEHQKYVEEFNAEQRKNKEKQ